MTQTIIEKLNQRIGYKESTTLSRDEYNELEDLLAETDELYNDCQQEIKNLEGTTKQLAQARDIIDGIVECIDDEGIVTESDRKTLAGRIVSAVKFTGNL